MRRPKGEVTLTRLAEAAHMGPLAMRYRVYDLLEMCRRLGLTREILDDFPVSKILDMPQVKTIAKCYSKEVLPLVRA